MQRGLCKIALREWKLLKEIAPVLLCSIIGEVKRRLKSVAKDITFFLQRWFTRDRYSNRILCQQMLYIVFSCACWPMAIHICPRHPIYGWPIFTYCISYPTYKGQDPHFTRHQSNCNWSTNDCSSMAFQKWSIKNKKMPRFLKPLVWSSQDLNCFPFSIGFHLFGADTALEMNNFWTAQKVMWK